jgi:hypothetical protein
MVERKAEKSEAVQARAERQSKGSAQRRQKPPGHSIPRGLGGRLQQVRASSHRSREGEEARGLHQGGGRPPAQGGKHQRRSWGGFRTAVEEDQRWSRGRVGGPPR